VTSDVLVELRGVSKHFRAHGQRRGTLHAVDDVDLEVRAGEILGIVGESGSGKTTLGRCVLGLTSPTAGSILIDGQPFDPDDPRLRRTVQPVFQDSFGSLDPRWTVRRSVREALDALRIGTREQRDSRVTEVLAEVGIGAALADRRPDTLSGGQRQRVGIAAALAPQPRLLVADEPVSALDVSVQAQILNLIATLRLEHGLTVVFITHDLSVVEHLADRVAVMYLGRIIEIAPTSELFAAPAHPYTRALLAAAPLPDPARRIAPQLAGEIPSAVDVPRGCAFHPRCPLAIDRCSAERPVDRGLSAARRVACHLAELPVPSPTSRT
jgi:peptide/nickel transport system ATP-binding protein/oligopeptide transport system ATP-binding protein